MKKLFTIIVILVGLVFFNFAEARVTSVRGYYKPSTGRYVTPYYKTTPNKSRLDNYSTKGNYNPYTGKTGTVNPWR